MDQKGIRIHPEYKIGLRTIKTALAVFLCLVIKLVTPMETALFAAIAAVVCMRETPEQSLEMGVHRFLGTLIGGVLGFLLLTAVPFIPYYAEGLYILIVPLVMIVGISVCVLTKRKEAVIICCVTLLAITLDTTLNTDSTILYVGMRILDTTVGVVIATLLNRFFFPYDAEGAKEEQPEEIGTEELEKEEQKK